MQSKYQFLTDKKVASGQNDNKLVAARTVNRTVLKNIADHFSGVFDIFVARLMPLRIVYDFQSVHVAGQ